MEFKVEWLVPIPIFIPKTTLYGRLVWERGTGPKLLNGDLSLV